MSNTAVYRDMAKLGNLPLRLRPDWLDAVYGADGWRVATVESEGRIIAAMPYVLLKRWTLPYVSQAPLDTYAGYWLSELALGGADAKEERKWGNLYKHLGNLIAQLPKKSNTALRLHPRHTNEVLPWKWANYQLENCITYRVSVSRNDMTVWNNIRHHLRSDINKAQVSGLSFRKGVLDVERIWPLLETQYLKKGIALPYSKTVLQRISALHHQIYCVEVFHPSNNALEAFVCIGYDETEATLLLQGRNVDTQSNQSLQWAQWLALEHSCKLGLATFDFEGSMLKNVEHQLRAWGGKPVSYVRVKKNYNILFRLAAALRQ